MGGLAWLCRAATINTGPKQPAGRWECSTLSPASTRAAGPELPLIHIYMMSLRSRADIGAHSSGDVTVAPLWSLSFLKLWQACDPCHSSAGCPLCRQGSIEWWLMLAWDVLPNALACVSNHGCWFQLAQSHAPILTSRFQGLFLWLLFSCTLLQLPLGKQGQIVWCLCGFW